jgi:hypothetical protein
VYADNTGIILSQEPLDVSFDDEEAEETEEWLLKVSPIEGTT